MMPDRTLCIIGEFPPPYGGMAVQAKLLCERLEKEGVRVAIVDRNVRLSPLFRWAENIPIIRSVITEVIFIFRIIKNMLTARQWYVFSNSYLSFYLYTVPPVVLGKLFGKRIIVSYHGGAAEAFLAKKGSFVALWILRSADSIVVASDFLKDILARFGLRAAVVPNTLDFKSFVFKKRDMLRPYFIVSRHLEPEYNVAMVLRAFEIIYQKYANAKLTICGDGSERNQLELLSRHLGLAGAVRFLGKVPNKDMVELYQQADIMLNGSRIDNLPVAVLEAFASGLPVVSTDAGGIKYLIQHGKNGLLVQVNDYKHMADAVLRLLKDPELSKDLSARAYKSLETYEWENVREKLKDIFH